MTVQLANMLLLKFGEGRKVNSGWRPPAVNVVNPERGHELQTHDRRAIDPADPDGDLDEWLMTAEGQAALVEIGLWMEHPAATKSWTHLQTVPPKSGRRTFYPTIPIPGIGALRAIGIGLMVAGACSIVSGVVYYAKAAPPAGGGAGALGCGRAAPRRCRACRLRPSSASSEQRRRRRTERGPQ